MPRAPAICPQCGTIFASPISINAQNATLTGITVTCPRCRAEAHIPSGVYSALNSTTLALTSERVSPEKLQQIISILESAQSKEATADEIARDIMATAPELSSVADVLPKKRNELYAFIAVLTAVISVILNQCQTNNAVSGVSEAEVQQIVDEAIESLF